MQEAVAFVLSLRVADVVLSLRPGHYAHYNKVIIMVASTLTWPPRPLKGRAVKFPQLTGWAISFRTRNDTISLPLMEYAQASC